jgi:hypothetical protein
VEADSLRLYYEAESGTYWDSDDSLNYASPTNNPTQQAQYTNEGLCIYATYTAGGGVVEPIIILRGFQTCQSNYW